MSKSSWRFLLVVALVLQGGCASLDTNTRRRQVASVLTYLFPGSEKTPAFSDKVAEIHVPFRIGVAFVPDSTTAQFRLPESDRLKLSGAVRDAFANCPFIGDIVAVPSLYLEPEGGFANLERIAALLKLDVITLISFDQVQNAGTTGWSFLY